MELSESESFREFVVERWPGLLRTAYLLVGDHGHAEDVVQTALAKVHRRWSRIDRSEALDGYVRRAVVNTANTHWRRRLRLREVSIAALPEPESEAAGGVPVDERDELWRALRTLPKRMRAVIVLRYFEELSEAETASALGCSTGTVKSQCSRGLSRLRAVLDDEGLGETASDPTGVTRAASKRGGAS